MISSAATCVQKKSRHTSKPVRTALTAQIITKGDQVWAFQGTDFGSEVRRESTNSTSATARKEAGPFSLGTLRATVRNVKGEMLDEGVQQASDPKTRWCLRCHRQ